MLQPVLGSGTGTLTQVADNPLGNSAPTGWVQFTFSFTPSATSTATLQFASPATDQGYAVLDNVSVTAVGVPEPATLGLLTLGAVGLLIAARRRKV